MVANHQIQVHPLLSVEENANFHCIICKAEFLTRSERNEHLETHFIHRSCKHCSRPVIVIGDLEFELHQPTYCEQTEPEQDNLFDAQNYDYKYEVEEAEEEEAAEEEQEDEVFVLSRRTKRNQTKVDYEEKANEIMSILEPKKERPVRKAKRKPIRKYIKVEKNETNSNDAKVDSEDDVFKEMDVAIKKRRKQYAKLPKTVPCTVCDAMFGTERTLKIHMNQIHGIKERYICPICSREFKISGNLKQHIETHSDYKRFICNYYLFIYRLIIDCLSYLQFVLICPGLRQLLW